MLRATLFDIKKINPYKKEKNIARAALRRVRFMVSHAYLCRRQIQRRMDRTEEMKCKSVCRYVDILSDAGFKAVFGEQRNSDVLKDFLNVVLPPEREVDTLSYMTTEIPGLTLANKSVRLDLRCTDRSGRVFIVEVQCYRQKNFFRRCVEYAARVYDSGTKRGNGNGYAIPPVYLICILGGESGVPGMNRESECWRDRYISEYTFREKVSGEVPDETILCMFVELNRFGKRLEDCGNLLEKWLYSLKHVGLLHGIPEGLRAGALERFFDACEIARFSPEQMIKFENDMMTERDYYNIINTAREDAETKGRVEGKEEEKRSIAKAMLSMGLGDDVIIGATGLSADELQYLKTGG